MSDCSIRLATPNDAGIINDIQNHYVLTSTATFYTEALTLEERLAWLRNRSPAHPVTVAQAEGASLAGARSRFSEDGARTGIRPSFRFTFITSGTGAGSAAPSWPISSHARGLQYHALVGECCSESTSVIALLEALGFDRVARFREVGRKFDRWLDVVFLERLL
ncbi:MAG: GNAT family N-acetyltransferase [Betaproteobacteria bacterium]|nr:GNAT family N-acetyltransferase [Betaproteobacteria bacterium]